MKSPSSSVKLKYSEFLSCAFKILSPTKSTYQLKKVLPVPLVMNGAKLIELVSTRAASRLKVIL